MADWREIPGVVGYRFNADGEAQTLWRRGGRRGESRLGVEWVPLAVSVNSEGYRMVRLRGGGARRSAKIHVVVLELFGPQKPFAGALSLHRDDDKSNNSLPNLYWGTRSDNENDKVKNGRNGQATLTVGLVATILRRLEAGERQSKIAADCGVHQSQVSRVKNRKTWRIATGVI